MDIFAVVFLSATGSVGQMRSPTRGLRWGYAEAQREPPEALTGRGSLDIFIGNDGENFPFEFIILFVKGHFYFMEEVIIMMLTVLHGMSSTSCYFAKGWTPGTYLIFVNTEQSITTILFKAL